MKNLKNHQWKITSENSPVKNHQWKITSEIFKICFSGDRIMDMMLKPVLQTYKSKDKRAAKKDDCEDEEDA